MGANSFFCHACPGLIQASEHSARHYVSQSAPGALAHEDWKTVRFAVSMQHFVMCQCNMFRRVNATSCDVNAVLSHKYILIDLYYHLYLGSN